MLSHLTTYLIPKPARTGRPDKIDSLTSQEHRESEWLAPGPNPWAAEGGLQLSLPSPPDFGGVLLHGWPKGCNVVVSPSSHSVAGKITSLKESTLCLLRDGVSLQKILPFKSLVFTSVFHHIEGKFASKMVEWEPIVVF